MRPFRYVDVSSQNSQEYWLQFPAKLMKEFWELKYIYISGGCTNWGKNILVQTHTCIHSKLIYFNSFSVHPDVQQVISCIRSYVILGLISGRIMYNFKMDLTLTDTDQFLYATWKRKKSGTNKKDNKDPTILAWGSLAHLPPLLPNLR